VDWGSGLEWASWTSLRKEVFFSEEKKQKTFTSWSGFSPAAHAITTKVFWFFFSKKNCLLKPACKDGAFTDLYEGRLKRIKQWGTTSCASR